MKKLNSDVIGSHTPERKVQAKVGALLFLKRQHTCGFGEAKMKTYAIKRNIHGHGVILSFACFLLFAALVVGCQTSRAVHELSFDGTVQSIDLQGRRLTVASLKQFVSEELVFGWDRRTKFWKNGQPVRADAVEAGRNVRVRYHEESGRLIPHDVYVGAP